MAVQTFATFFFFYFAFNYNASIEILKLWIAWCDFLSDLKHVY